MPDTEAMAERALNPPRLWLHIVARNGESQIRKWSHAPFDGAVEYARADDYIAIPRLSGDQGAK